MDQIQGAGLLGFGMNVISTTPENAVTAAVVTPVSGDAGTYPYNDVEYIIPLNVSVTPGFGDETTSGTVIVGSTRAEFQSKLSAELGITGSYNAFSGTFNLAFANELKSQSQYDYAVLQANYQAYTLLLQEEAGTALDPTFVNDPDVQTILTSSTFDPTNPWPFYRVFEKWGTHYVNQVSMGASLQYYAAVEATQASSEQTVSSSLQLEYNAVFVSAGATAKADWTQLGQTWASSRNVSILATGGSTALISALDPTFGENFNSQFEQWRSSVPSNLGVQRFGVRDLSTLFSGAAAQAVSEALDAYLAYGLDARAAFDYAGSVVTGISTLISVNGQQVSPTSPPPTSDNSAGGIQLVAVDPQDLSILANEVAYPEQILDCSAAWAQIQEVVESLDETDYFVLLTLFGTTNGISFPPAATATWMQSCGASLEAMQSATQYYCGEDYRIAYALVGQQGLQAGAALETFAINTQGDHEPSENGYFYADAYAPLSPDPGGGNFHL
jgi:hypothetical protein